MPIGHLFRTLLGALLAIIGLYLSHKGWKRKKPMYLIISNNIFSGLEHAIPDVEVKFPGYSQPVKTLTVTKIAFWNAGTETIKRQDVVKEDPITIQAKEGVVLLSASIIESTSSLNKIECKLNQERSVVTITFEYLDHNQGTNIQLFHTGKTNADLTIKGTIMGAPPIRKVLRGNSSNPPPPIWVPLLIFTIIWALWLLLKLGILTARPEPEPPIQQEPISTHAFGIGLLVFTICFAFILYLFHIPKPFSKILRQ